MTELFNRLDFYISIIGIGLVLFLWGRRAWRRFMLRWQGIPTIRTDQLEYRSYAVEAPTEPAGTEVVEPIPTRESFIKWFESLSDNERLEVLASIRNEDGTYSYAESRVGKFIGGRVEDRIAQVRRLRDLPIPIKQGRILHIRDVAGERSIPWEPVKQQKA
jgi:hypothetical protein